MEWEAVTTLLEMPSGGEMQIWKVWKGGLRWSTMYKITSGVSATNTINGANGTNQSGGGGVYK